MLLLLSVVSFAASARTVYVECTTGADKIELRDGGPEGTLLDVTIPTYGSVEVEFETSLYIELTDPDLQLSSVQVGYYDSMPIVDNTCTIGVDDVSDGQYITINVQVPKKVTVNVPDPSLVTIMTGAWGDEFELVEGANLLTFGQYDAMLIKVKDPENYRLTRVYAQRGTEVIDFNVSSFTSCNAYSSDFYAGDVFSYVVIPASEFVAPSFKIRVDEPENCRVAIGYTDVDGLVANEWKTIEMRGTTENVSISHKTYGNEIYSVKVNGVEQTSSYGSYYLYDIKEDDEIDVKVAFPDEDYTVTVSADPLEGLGVVTSVTIDGEEVENWQEGMTVHCGKKVKFELNKTLYTINGIKINDVPQNITYLYTYYEVKIIEDTQIVFEADKKPTYTVSLVVDNASAVNAALSYNKIALHDGENEIEYTSDANYLVVEPVFCAKINSLKVTVEDDGEVIVYDNYDGKLTRYLDETVKLVEVEAENLARDKKFVAYLDANLDSDDLYYTYFYSDSDPNHQNRKVAKGYNVIEFCDMENPFVVNWYPRSDVFAGYLNGEELETSYYGGFEELVVEDGDVFKVFDITAPETFTVNFETEEERHFTMKKDIITPVEDFTAPLSDFGGTLFTLTPDAEYQLEVVVTDAVAAVAEEEGEDDEPAGKLVANDEGNYEFVLDGDKNVTVKAVPLTGIESVNAAATVKANNDVYTVSGVLVLRNATPAQIKSLPTGLYIVDGKKFVQK